MLNNEDVEEDEVVSARVLVIDRYAGFREAMEYCFSNAGITALSADSVARALPVMREQAVDLVLLDATDSFEAGLDECRAMKARPEFAQVSVVLLATRVAGQQLDEARRAGALTVLPRLFEWVELMQWVERAVANKESRGKSAP